MKHLNKISFVLIVMVIGYLGLKEFNAQKEKLAVIQMEELVYEYQGMKDATAKYQQKMNTWSMRADSLEDKLKTLYNEIQMDSINGNLEKLNRDKQSFYHLRNTYYEYQQKISEKAKQDDQEMTIGILNQLKEHVKNYATLNDYDIIIANTQLENVSYVNQKNDVTAELLAYANQSYNGE